MARAKISPLPIREFKSDGGVLSVAFNRSGDRVVASDARTISVWDIQTAEPVVKPSIEFPQRVVLLPGSDDVVVCASAKQLVVQNIWQETPLRVLAEIPAGPRQSIAALAVSDQCNLLLTGASELDNNGIRYAVLEARSLTDFATQLRYAVEGSGFDHVSVTPDGQRFVVAGACADEHTGLLCCCDTHGNELFTAHCEPAIDMTMSSDGRFVAMLGSASNAIRLFDVSACRFLPDVPVEGVNQMEWERTVLAFLPNSHTLITGACRIKKLTRAEKTAVARAMMFGDTKPGPKIPRFQLLELWDVDQRSCINVVERPEYYEAMIAIAVSPDGSSVAIAEGESVAIWKLED